MGLRRTRKQALPIAGAVPYFADLDTPLLSIGGEIWDIRAAAEATAIWGAPGSGKSSSSGKMIARSFLAAGMGVLVLCAKNDEVETWTRYAREAGREDDLIVIDESCNQRFNIFDYASATLAKPGFEQNLVFLMQTMVEATQIASGAGGGDGENNFFVEGARKWCANAFPLLRLVEGTLRLSDLNQFIATAPKSLEARQSEEWKRGYCAQVHQKANALSKKGGEGSYATKVVNDHGAFFLTEYPNLDNRPRSSIESTLTNMIYPFLTGKLGELFCTTTTVTPEMCRDGKIIIMDLPVLRYGATGAVAQSLFKYLFGIAVQNTRVTPETRPVALFADEAQFFMSRTDAELLSTARSSKTCIVYITQDLPTYYARLGKGAQDIAESIISKFGTRIFHANTSQQTNQYASEIIGKVQKTTVNQTHSRGRNVGGGGSHDEQGLGYQGQDGRNSGSSESTSTFLDYEISPDYFATKLRTGSARNQNKVDGIVIRNGRNWEHTGRHWIQAEFDQA